MDAARSIAAMMRRASGHARSVMASHGREARFSSMYLAADSMLMSGSPARLRSNGQLLAIHLESPIPVAVDSLPRLSDCFAPPFRVVKDLALRRLLRFFGLGNLTRRIGSINNTRVCFQGVARAHTVNYAII